MKPYWIIITGTNSQVGPFSTIRDAKAHISEYKIVGGLIVKEVK
jgi:hypothetical protein